MRALSLFLAAVLMVGSATPALASVGLPRLGELRAGPHELVLYNDSPKLIAGRNTMSLEVPAGIDHEAVQLVLLGAGGQTLPVRMRPVIVLGGEDAHADHGDGAHATEAAEVSPFGSGHTQDGGGGHGDSHSSEPAAPAEADRHEQAEAPGMMLRGTVTVPSVGRWRASLTVAERAEPVHTAEITLDAVRGGPNRLYLLATGLLIGGALVVGLAGRHLPIARPVAESGKPGRQGR